jgi:hypothetical protein
MEKKYKIKRWGCLQGCKVSDAFWNKQLEKALTI